MYKKAIPVLVIIILSVILMTGCKKGTEVQNNNMINYSILMNYGSCFVYTFEDSETGIWYISTSGGVTPRLNSDGTLYVSK